MSSKPFPFSWTNLTTVQVSDAEHRRVPDGTFGVAALPSEAWAPIQALIEHKGDWCEDNELATLSCEHVDELVGKMEGLRLKHDPSNPDVSIQHVPAALANVQKACELARKEGGSIMFVFY